MGKNRRHRIYDQIIRDEISGPLFEQNYDAHADETLSRNEQETFWRENSDSTKIKS